MTFEVESGEKEGEARSEKSANSKHPMPILL